MCPIGTYVCHRGRLGWSGTSGLARGALLCACPLVLPCIGSSDNPYDTYERHWGTSPKESERPEPPSQLEPPDGFSQVILLEWALKNNRCGPEHFAVAIHRRGTQSCVSQDLNRPPSTPRPQSLSPPGPAGRDLVGMRRGYPGWPARGRGVGAAGRYPYVHSNTICRSARRASGSHPTQLKFSPLRSHFGSSLGCRSPCFHNRVMESFADSSSDVQYEDSPPPQRALSLCGAAKRARETDLEQLVAARLQIV